MISQTCLLTSCRPSSLPAAQASMHAWQLWVNQLACTLCCMAGGLPPNFTSLTTPLGLFLCNLPRAPALMAGLQHSLRPVVLRSGHLPSAMGLV